jgi:putative sterol carrier protein
VFQPTQKWAAELCRGLYHEGAEGVLVVSVEEAPPDVSPTRLLTPLLEFREGRCVRAELSPEPQDGDYVLEGAYSDYLKIFEGKLPPSRRGKYAWSVSKLADYMPLALEMVKAARKAVGYM